MKEPTTQHETQPSCVINAPISYVLHREKRKSLRLVVRGGGVLHVHVPGRMSMRKIDESIRNEYAWIERTILTVKSHPDVGETLMAMGKIQLFGTHYPLCWIPLDSGRSKLCWHKGVVSVYAKSEALAQQTLNRWMKERVHRLAAGCIRRIAAASADGIAEPERISVRAMRSRWGSCSATQSISLNTYLLQLPFPLIEYVMAHELSHLTVMNHSKAFYAHLATLLPDWQERKDQLRSYRLR